MNLSHGFIRLRLTAGALLLLWCVSAEAQPQGDRGAALRMARKLMAEHDAAGAEAVMRTVVEREPGNVDALAVLAEARLAQGQGDEAKALLVRALTVKPTSLEVNDVLGGLLLAEHHVPEAMDRFETVLMLQLTDAEARRGELAAATELAGTARSAAHPEIALEVLQHARAKLPDEPKLLLALGNQASDLHLPREAREAFAAALRLSPNDPEVLYALGQLETEEQHLPAAEAALRAYLAMQPRDATAHYGLGHVLAMEQRRQEARAEFVRCIELQPVQTESYYQIGQIELEEDHDALAEVSFRKTLERDPTHGGALTGMGILAFRAKEYAKAEASLAAAEKTAPEYGTAHYYRGLSLARMGRKSEADVELHTATELGRAATGVAQSGTLAAPPARVP